MHILCFGGGPAGLYFSILMKLQNPATQVTVMNETGLLTPLAGAWCCRTRHIATCRWLTRSARD